MAMTRMGKTMIQTKIGIITWAGFAEIKNVLIQFLKLQESSICVFQEFETLIENRYISFLICYNENRIEQFFVCRLCEMALLLCWY